MSRPEFEIPNNSTSNTPLTVQSMLKELKANLNNLESLLVGIEKFDIPSQGNKNKINNFSFSTQNLNSQGNSSFSKEKNLKYIYFY